MAPNNSSQPPALAHLKALHDTTNTEIASFQAELDLQAEMSKRIINTYESGELTHENLATLTSREDEICKLLFKRYSDVRKAFGVLSGMLFTFISESDRAADRDQKLLRETLARKLMLWDFLEGLRVIPPTGSLADIGREEEKRRSGMVENPAKETKKNIKATKRMKTAKADRQTSTGHDFVPYKDEPEGEAGDGKALLYWGFQEYDPKLDGGYPSTSTTGKKVGSGEEGNLIDIE